MERREHEMARLRRLHRDFAVSGRDPLTRMTSIRRKI
jgi:hypothetical protein